MGALPVLSRGVLPRPSHSRGHQEPFIVSPPLRGENGGCFPFALGAKLARDQALSIIQAMKWLSLSRAVCNKGARILSAPRLQVPLKCTGCRP